jgi:hypothetical protein
MTDGKIHLTTIPSDVLAALFSSLHETLHREGTVGELSEKERTLYDAVVDELTARAEEVEREKKPECSRWVVLFEPDAATRERDMPAMTVEGTLQVAKKAANDHAVRYQAKSYVVIPYVVSAEGHQ